MWMGLLELVIHPWLPKYPPAWPTPCITQQNFCVCACTHRHKCVHGLLWVQMGRDGREVHKWIQREQAKEAEGLIPFWLFSPHLEGKKKKKKKEKGRFWRLWHYSSRIWCWPCIQLLTAASAGFLTRLVSTTGWYYMPTNNIRIKES